MPDLMAMIQPLCTAAVSAAAVLFIWGWPRRGASATWLAIGCVLAVGIGLALGCWQLGLRLHWPPCEDQDRWLLVLLPVVLGLEIVGAFSSVPRWPVWSLRVLTAAAAAPILLYQSIYLADVAGPNTRQWSPTQAGLILGSLALGLTVVWVALGWLAHRSPDRVIPFALSLTLCGTAITVMLSGYYTGGQPGLLLAAALAGMTLGSLTLRAPVNVTGALGVSIVGLFALLVSGRFFSALPTTQATVLFAAPLLCWIGELPFLRSVPSGLRGFIVLALVAAPVALVVQQAYTSSLGTAGGWVRVDG
jgi:hypothetical protein